MTVVVLVGHSSPKATRSRAAGGGAGVFRQYTDTETPGTHGCICCSEPLFTSGEKFHHGCGWTSFSMLMVLDPAKPAGK